MKAFQTTHGDGGNLAVRGLASQQAEVADAPLLAV
jgi:hypothetical protein